ncbi:DUF3592 domain-containing protein [uncultured Nostoc sp.]|uniref:DUF3592 domain-containing protein n=1 Tax=uncultured Nostoc sp. TaxID=340711 RepID=UPI0035CB1799
MKNNNRISLLWLLIGLLVFCTLIVAGTYFAVETKSRDTILTEIAKSFIQLGAVGALGAVVKFALDQISESQRQQQADLEVKRELLERLRKFKHIVRTIPYRIEEERTVEAYRREIRALLNIYMEIGDFGNDTRLFEFVHPYNERIGIHIWMMSIFVSKILDEATKVSIDTWAQIDKLPVFKYYKIATLDFLGVQEKYTPYHVDYNAHYDAIKGELRLLISGQRSSKWSDTKGLIVSLGMNEYKTTAGTMYKLNLKYRYFIKGKKFESDINFNSFEQQIVESALTSFSKSKDEVTIYYDPVNPKVSVVKRPSEHAS